MTLPNNGIWIRKNNRFMVENAGKHHLRQIIKVNIPNDVKLK